MNVPPMLLCDFYKISHREQYPANTEIVYSTWTPRSNKHCPTADKVVAFALQGFIQEFLIDYFNEHFFSKQIDSVVYDYWRYLHYTLGVDIPYTEHIKDLHELGYLPLCIRSVPEGTLLPMGVPMMTIMNTDPRFAWLTNFIETLASCELWLGSTSATIAYGYRKLLDKYCEITGGDPEFVKFQGHDFSMRGMASASAAKVSGAGHLLSFVGTDTIPAIWHLEQYYGADIVEGLVGTSIPATEHSVMSAGIGFQGEFETYKRLITEVYPSGMVSIVSDTMDLWECIENVIIPLKDIIMARDGRVVIRPDSGDPVDILTGIPLFRIDDRGYDTKTGRKVTLMEHKGLIEVLYDIFGGYRTEKDYRMLDPHIGTIYGDSITQARCEEICKRLYAKGFASTNVVFGIGSYTYQYNTRDTFGWALKSTMTRIAGRDIMIFKDPKTDDGTKRSHKGVVAVTHDLKCVDQLGFNHEVPDIMETVFYNGRVKTTTVKEIRGRLHPSS